MYTETWTQPPATTWTFDPTNPNGKNVTTIDPNAEKEAPKDDKKVEKPTK